MFVHWPTLFRALKLMFSRKYFRPRHALYAVVLTVIVLLIVLLGTVGRLLDHVLFPGFRKQKVVAPVFILANPRSGTTLLHRLMCQDEERFTCFKLYETILPSVFWYRVFDGLGRVDRLVGRPLGRLMGFIERVVFSGFQDIHPMGWTQAEEDEAIWLFTLLTPSFYLLFPFFDELDYVAFADQVDDRSRAKLMRYYRSTVQRHLYARGPELTYLCKSVFAAGRVNLLMEAFPDAKVVNLVRHPYKAIPSLVSMFHAAWHGLNPELAKDSPPSRALAQMGMSYYRYYLTMGEQFPEDRYATVLYDDLVRDPKSAVERVYGTFGIPLTPDVAAALAAETEKQQSYRSRHGYALEDFGLTPDEVREELTEAFQKYNFAG